jgi:DNA polymerase I-like protein with 3'-5' exonuclease and polymerase domains
MWAAKREKRQKLYSYNCKDVCTDFEIWLAHEKELATGPKAWRQFFDYEMSLLPAAHSIMQAGQLVDQIRLQQIKHAVEQKLAEQQKGLNTLLGAKDVCNSHSCVCGRCVNVNSNKQISLILYEALKLPKRTRRDKYGESKVTTEENALVSLIAVCKDKLDSLSRADAINEWKRKLLVVKLVVLIRGGRKMKSSYLDVRLSEDGRLRSRYKWGTETGRWSAEKYCDGTGVNAQTFPRSGVDIEEEVA